MCFSCRILTLDVLVRSLEGEESKEEEVVGVGVGVGVEEGVEPEGVAKEEVEGKQNSVQDLEQLLR